MNNKLYLIDGHALVFKMYYAFLRRPMINSKGVDTSILFGFTKYILELINKEEPSHIAVAFDPPGKTFRHEMFPEYKGTRSATPQLVIDALEPLIKICGGLKIPVLMQKGFEADDVIGSMAKRAEKEGYQVYMVTPDKDYGQLISENIFQFKPGKSGGENELFDTKGICEKYGIEKPIQVIDLLSICGDSSDNVPGVKGVGEVGASKLISKYGSLENIYANLDELTPKQRDAFEAAKGHIDLSKTLVTIKIDMEIETSVDQMRIDPDFTPEIVNIFEEFEFDSLRRHIAHIKVEDTKVQEDRTGWDEVPINKITSAATERGFCAILVDGDSLCLASSLSQVDKGNYYCSGKIADFKQILENEKITKIGYNLKVQNNSLTKKGLKLEGNLWDIELMHYLINPEKSHKIEILSKSYLNVNANLPQVVVSAPMSLFDEVEEGPQEVKSNARELVITSLLGEKIYKELQEKELVKLYEEIEEPLIRVLSKMECVGVKIDTKQLSDFAKKLSEELEICQAKIREMADEPTLNISSPKQVGIVLYEKLGLDDKIAKKNAAKRSYPTDEETLNSLSSKHEIIDQILEYRGLKKLLSTYIEPFPGFISKDTGRVHTTFNQALTATGRLSSSKPNLQNIPIRTERGKEIRKAFIPEDPNGFLMSADYSQIELRIMAHLSCDEHLVGAFRSDLDIHASTAAKIFGVSVEQVTPEQRRIAKTANFGIMYGISAFGLSQRLKIGMKDAKKIINDYFENFPAISSYIDYTVAAAKENLYVETIFGRRRYLPDIVSRNATVRSLSERNAINAPIQGSSADIIKLAMIQVDKKITEAGLKSRMVLQIHDELVFETNAQEAETLKKIVVEAMENVVELSIPLTVDCKYGKNWLEAH